MKSVQVRLSARPYPIFAGAPLSKMGEALRRQVRYKDRPASRAVVVTHPFLERRYGPALRKALAQAGMTASFVSVPPGEHRKNLRTVEQLYSAFVRAGLDRSSCVIALGGGVAGDMAGFAAATYLRGIQVVQVPTTLLAMVDSSIGGKTGVDLPEAKNFVGSFHQPSMVWIDPAVLSTLPEREFHNGMAEVIKYGVIADSQLFSLLERLSPLSPKSPRMLDIIARCAAIKAGVVSKDEHETKGLREILNFGHTIGHAVETVTQYRVYKHGEAVSIGMCAAGFMAMGLGLWPLNDLQRLERLLVKNHLPIRLKGKLGSAAVLAALSRDKKVLSGELRFVLPSKIGRVAVHKVPAALALGGLAYVQPGTGR